MLKADNKTERTTPTKETILFAPNSAVLTTETRTDSEEDALRLHFCSRSAVPHRPAHLFMFIMAMRADTCVCECVEIILPQTPVTLISIGSWISSFASHFCGDSLGASEEHEIKDEHWIDRMGPRPMVAAARWFSLKAFIIFLQIPAP